MSNNGHRRCRQGDGGALPGTNDTRARRGGVGCIASGAPHVWRRRGERPGVEEKSEPPQCGVSIWVSWLGLDWVLSDCSISILCKEARSLTRLHHSSCRDEMASCPLDQAAKLLTTDRPPNHDGIPSAVHQGKEARISTSHPYAGPWPRFTRPSSVVESSSGSPL